MKVYSLVIVIILIFISCGEIKKPRVEKSNLVSVFNELKKDYGYKNFIGYHIVRRGGENQFYYSNLNDTSSSWQSSVLYDGKGEELLKPTKLFFEKNLAAKLQFDIMINNGIKAVITRNYNHETKKLEYQEYGGYDFNNYELTFMISDSISITNINFDSNNYFKIIDEHSQVTEKLDSNWFVLKRK